MVTFEIRFPDDLSVEGLAERVNEIDTRLRDPSFYECFSLVISHGDRVVFEELPLDPAELLCQLLKSFEDLVAGSAFLVGEEEETWMFYTDNETAEFVRADFEIYSLLSDNGDYCFSVVTDIDEIKRKAELYWSLSMDVGSWLEGLADWGSQFVQVIDFGRDLLIEGVQKGEDEEPGESVHRIFALQEKVAESTHKIRARLRSHPPQGKFSESLLAS